ncbi:hypothetical protein AWM75_03105 [Aerococcus urinaehominis]|uniref:Uncharacterized protein n=1 Tax=Aerococcus urinaehominis TaxID=128944 RepID=A0A0X8FL32_9LACT|nr:hypothetical protein [Aerococcus urinaehominis]AMB99049.1 hypothetical protein AWM75_03105 [Aerococcus urinaehominis]SDM50454.1 hypothetical protein SAMN04487985_1207 [Aerococcus urinaehominis]
MTKAQDEQFQRFKEKLTGDYTEDMATAIAFFKNNNQVNPEELIELMASVLVEQHPEFDSVFSEVYHFMANHDDQTFIDRMYNLLDQEAYNQAQFEMSIFMRRMENDFEKYRPKLNTSYLCIHSLIDLFQFNINNPYTMELVIPDRNYSYFYKVYGEILTACNERREAVEAYQQSLLWNPYDTEVIYTMARLYHKMGQGGMFYTTVLNGLSYSIRTEDLATGFALMGDFYRYTQEYSYAAQLYYLSNDWSKNDYANIRLQGLEEKITLPQKFTGDQADRFLANLNLSIYPNADDLDKLLGLGSRFLVAQDYQTAQHYYRLYTDIVDNEDVNCRLAQIEAKLADEA